MEENKSEIIDIDSNMNSNNINNEEENKSHKKRLLLLLLLLFFIIIIVFSVGFIIKRNSGSMSFNIDIDDDGIPDLNLDFDTKECKVNCSKDNKKPNTNIDYGGNKKPTFNVDTTGDGKADTNLINQDRDGDGKCDLNCDTNDDG